MIELSFEFPSFTVERHVITSHKAFMSEWFQLYKNIISALLLTALAMQATKQHSSGTKQSSLSLIGYIAAT